MVTFVLSSAKSSHLNGFCYPDGYAGAGGGLEMAASNTTQRYLAASDKMRPEKAT